MHRAMTPRVELREKSAGSHWTLFVVSHVNWINLFMDTVELTGSNKLVKDFSRTTPLKTV